MTFTSPKPIRGKTSFTVEDVRKKFADGAMIVLYLCHSGQDSAFLKQIAGFFGVTVIGFSDEIVYNVSNSPCRQPDQQIDGAAASRQVRNA